MSLLNLGGTSALPEGALVGSGQRVTSGAQPGPDAPPNAPKRYAIIAHTASQGTDGGPMDAQIVHDGENQGVTVIRGLSKILDPDNIVTIGGGGNRTFKLPVGSWKIRVRVPGYYCKAFQAYLYQRPGTGPVTVYLGETGDLLAIGNGYAGFDTDGADPQRHAVLAALVAVSDPAKYFEVWTRQESWSHTRTSPLRERALGVASNFDDGAATAVGEIYTTIEIEEL
jgi:hypothetical protein